MRQRRCALSMLKAKQRVVSEAEAPHSAPHCFRSRICEVYAKRMQNTGKAQGEAVLETREIGIYGMTCDNCVRKVEKALRSNAGVKDVKVDRVAARATVTFDTTQTDMPALQDALLKSGYQPRATAP